MCWIVCHPCISALSKHLTRSRSLQQILNGFAEPAQTLKQLPVLCQFDTLRPKLKAIMNWVYSRWKCVCRLSKDFYNAAACLQFSFLVELLHALRRMNRLTRAYLQWWHLSSSFFVCLDSTTSETSDELFDIDFFVLSSSAVRVKSSYTMGMILSHMDASPFNASCRLLMKRLTRDVSAGIRNDGARVNRFDRVLLYKLHWLSTNTGTLWLV